MQFRCCCLILLAFFLVGCLPTVPLIVVEPTGVDRVDEPVTSGVPFAQGQVFNTSRFYVISPEGKTVPAQFHVTGRWPDGSIRWVLADFQVTLRASRSATYQLGIDGRRRNPRPDQPVVYSPGSVATGKATFTFNENAFDLFSSVAVGGQIAVQSGAGIELETSSGQVHSSQNSPTTVTMKERGPMKVVLEVKGEHRTSGGSPLGQYTCWLHFYAGSSMVRAWYRLENRQTMSHLNNFWDLGSNGRYLFDELRLGLDVLQGPGAQVEIAGSGGLVTGSLTSGAYIYQDSSGGDNWDSQNHIDGSYQVQTSFKGYQTRLNDSLVDSGTRPIGYLDVSDGNVGVAVSVRHFWQNFPNKLSINGGRLNVALWPAEFAHDHEVQGGEFKTHEVMLYFHQGDAVQARAYDVAKAFEDPLLARPDAAVFSQTKVFGDFVPYDASLKVYEELNETLFTPHGGSPYCAVTQREQIDEYGWRNFGDMMAEHETECGYQSYQVPISHYNNQYDAAYGGLLGWARTGKREFLDFGAEYARHVADIDINHADADGVYAHGMFWHTTHDVNALTSTHRTWSKDHKASCPGYPWLDGGGPGLGHVYVRGLFAYYYLRGYYPAIESAMEVAGFVPTYYTAAAGGGALGTREAGNLITTLCWAYRHDPQQLYYDTMTNCINASGPGFTWGSLGGMYPTALGEFLRLKNEMGQPGDSDAVNALNNLLANSDQALAQGLSGVTVSHIRFSESLGFAHRYAPVSHINKDAYRTVAGQIWNASLPTTSAYPLAKPASFIATASHTWPWFAAGGE